MSNRPPDMSLNSASRSPHIASKSSSRSCRRLISFLCFCIFENPAYELENELSGMKRLGKARRRIALDTTKSQVAAEQVRIEPLASALRREALKKCCDFQVDGGCRHRTIHA